MSEPLLNGLVVYLAGLFLVPNLAPGGRLRRAAELAYWPFVKLGLWYRWSMYAPEVPTGTQIALTGVVFGDGSFEVIPLPGFDDGDGFGKALGLRYIAFQWALCDPQTDYLKPALCDYALRLWRSERAVESEDGKAPVAVEIRIYRYPSPEPGRRETQPRPQVRTVWRRSVETCP